jgi:hypothetical protein
MPDSKPLSGWARYAPALRHRNFRRYFAGQALSVLGSWIQTVAMIWVVYRLTGSAALLGITAFLSQAPQLLISPLAGVWIDRLDRRQMLLGVQCLHMTQALGLALLSFTEILQPWHPVTLAGVQGVLNSFDTPCGTALWHGCDGRSGRRCGRAQPGSGGDGIGRNCTAGNGPYLVGAATQDAPPTSELISPPSCQRRLLPRLANNPAGRATHTWSASQV